MNTVKFGMSQAQAGGAPSAAEGWWGPSVVSDCAAMLAGASESEAILKAILPARTDRVR